MSKKQNLKKYLIFSLALLFIFCFLSSPTLALISESCCICHPFMGDSSDKSVGGPPHEGSCDSYVETECIPVLGEVCMEIPKNSCSVKGGSCEAWKKAIEDVKGDEAKRGETLPATPPKLQINIPGLKFTAEIKATMEEMGYRYYNIPWLAEYMSAIYKFGVGAGAVLAVVMIIIGGFIWLTSAGNQALIGQAKGFIGGALIGLVLLLSSYTVLKIVNPALVNLRPLKILMIEYEKLEEFENETYDDTVDTEVPLTFIRESSGVKHILQGSYASVPYNGSCGTTNKSVKTSGCGIASAAMVLDKYGKNVTPAHVAKFLLDKGYRASKAPPSGATCNGISHEAISAIAQNWGMSAEQVGVSQGDQLLKQGNPIIVHVRNPGGCGKSPLTCKFTKCGHYIVLTAVDDQGVYSVNDPGSSSTHRHGGTLSELTKGCQNVGWIYMHP